MLTKEREEEVINELLVLRNTNREYSERLRALNLERESLTTELANTKTLLTVCIEKIQAMEKK